MDQYGPTGSLTTFNTSIIQHLIEIRSVIFHATYASGQRTEMTFPFSAHLILPEKKAQWNTSHVLESTLKTTHAYLAFIFVSAFTSNAYTCLVDQLFATAFHFLLIMASFKFHESCVKRSLGFLETATPGVRRESLSFCFQQNWV
jgi:hypothetical protein